MTDGPIINHDHQEPKIDRTPGPWRWVFPVLAVVAAVNVYTGQLSWPSFLGGIGFGGVLAAWAIEVTGNKVPDSWRSRSAHRNADRNL
jgi:hypothetical protein